MELCIEVDHINQTTKYIDCGLESLQDADTEISVHVYFVGESAINVSDKYSIGKGIRAY